MKTTRFIIFEFFILLQQTLYQHIWPQHNSHLRAWERARDINSKMKRRKNTKKRHFPRRTGHLTKFRSSLPTTNLDPHPWRTLQLLPGLQALLNMNILSVQVLRLRLAIHGLLFLYG